MTDPDDTTEKPIPEDPIEAAAYWDARLRSPDCTQDERQTFKLWYAEDPAHARAYDRAQLAFSALLDARNQPELRAMRDEVMRDVRSRKKAPTRTYALIGGLAAAAAALTLAITLPFNPITETPTNDPVIAAPDRPEPIQTAELYVPPFYASNVGEVREITLPDGSIVTLNTNALLRERYDGGTRRLTLLRGQAEFDVEHDPSRPFIVEAGGRDITALGTIFDVWLQSDGLTVTQIEGVVEVTERATNTPDTAPRSWRLEVGDQLVLTAGATASLQKLPDVSAETLWQEGRVFFEDTSLAAAIAEIARYSPRPIEAEGLPPEGFAINGMFRTSEPEEFLIAIEAAFPITVDRTDPAAIRISLRDE